MLGTREVIDGLFAAAATGEVEPVLRWWADDGVLDDITLARRYSGKAELRPYLEMYYRAFPQLTYEPSLLLIDGSSAMVEWAQVTRLEGTFDGLPGDGRELRLRAVDLFEIRDGLVVHESSWYGDGWLRQRLQDPHPELLPAPLPRGEAW